MKLSWMMEERLNMEIELGIAPAFEYLSSGSQSLEDISTEDLIALAAWLEGKALAGPDRQNVKAELEKRAQWMKKNSHYFTSDWEIAFNMLNMG